MALAEDCSGKSFWDRVLSRVQLSSGVRCRLRGRESSQTHETAPRLRPNMAASSPTPGERGVYSPCSDDTCSTHVAPPSHVNIGQSHCAPSSINPPSSLTAQLFRRVNRALPPLQSVIERGDVESLRDLLRSDTVTKPDADGWTALHLSANCGQLPCVRLLLSAHPDLLNRCTPGGRTALMLAVQRGHTPCVELLLKYGANPDTANTDRDTALYLGCERRDEASVALLLRAGAKVNRGCSLGNTALHEACRHGHSALCRTLLNAGANPKSKNMFGIEPLFTAAQNGNCQAMQLLAQRGAEVNSHALDGASPLFEASKNGHESAVELLLSLKADANHSNKSGLLPLHVAAHNNHLQVVSLLLPFTSRGRVRSSGISPLHLAAERDHETMLEQLISAGFDVNAPLSEERSWSYADHRSSALCFSVRRGNLRTAHALLEAGADTEQDVFCPLLVAVRMGWVDLTALLLQYGANAHAQVPDQPSAFPPALHLGLESLPTVKLLLDHGCDAESCFRCSHGPRAHPPPPSQRPPRDELRCAHVQLSDQFCEAVSRLSLCHLTGPLVSLLLDYVGHVQLCAKLVEVLQPCSLWSSIKLTTSSPRSLVQLCRLLIRRALGVQRLRRLPTLPLPVRLIHFLQHRDRAEPL